MDLILDPDDDVALQMAIRRHCAKDAGRLLISPGPGTYSIRSLACAMLEVLGVELHSREKVGIQLGLFATPNNWSGCLGGPVPDRRGQLPLFPKLEPQFQGVGYPAVHLEEVVGPLLRAGIHELVVLRAQAVEAGEWWDLCCLAARCGIRLCLVVHGRPPTDAQRSVLARCRVRHRTVPMRRSRTGSGGAPAPWWSTPSYSARSSRVQRLRREAWRRGWRQPTAGCSSWRRAVAQLTREAAPGGVSFLATASPPELSSWVLACPEEAALRQERVRAVWSGLITRLAAQDPDALERVARRAATLAP